MLHRRHDHRLRLAVQQAASIWIGCIAAPTAIVPTNEPASDGHAERVGKLFRNKKPASCDAKRPSGGIVIVLVSFNIEKSESCIAVAHCKIEALT